MKNTHLFSFSIKMRDKREKLYKRERSKRAISGEGSKNTRIPTHSTAHGSQAVDVIARFHGHSLKFEEISHFHRLNRREREKLR
jgi:hypothetical protein